MRFWLIFRARARLMLDFVLGDFAALGNDPVTPLEKVTALSHASFTRGNTDRYVVTGDLPVQPEKALGDPALLPEVIEAVRSFSWTRAISAPRS
jgi:hypothetical protein